MAWVDRTATNVFPLSEEKQDLRKALSEWEYYGVKFDIGYAEEICQLCDHENIRYRFEIVNRHNRHALLIGSQCILKYSDIGVLNEEGKRLDTKASRKKVGKDVRKLVNKAQADSVFASLIELGRIPGEKIDFNDLLEKYAENGTFTPHQLSVSIFRLEKNGIRYIRRYFKMSLKTKRDKLQIQEMELWRIGKIWDCFASHQKEIARKLRDDIPRTGQWA